MNTTIQRRTKLARFIYNNFEQVYPQDWTERECEEFIRTHCVNSREMLRRK